MDPVAILLPLSLVQMFKFFSHYGMRALLVLYLVDQQKFGDVNAFGISAVFLALGELGGVFGGIIADRFLGLQRSIILGSFLLVAGYFMIILEEALFVAMGLIIAGGSFFSGNIMALLGKGYSEAKEGRERGFTLFYMMQNLGALLSMFLCALVADCFGFRAGFAFASLGMFFALIIFLFHRRRFEHLGIFLKTKRGDFYAFLGVFVIFAVGTCALFIHKVIAGILPLLTIFLLATCILFLLKGGQMKKEEIYRLSIYLTAMILFYAASDQICSSLVLFTERIVPREYFGILVPSSLITSLNPLVIILLGTTVIGSKEKLLAPFMLVGVSFGILALLCMWGYAPSLPGIMVAVVGISIAELMIGPMVTSYASEAASKSSAGFVMGMIPIAYSFAFQLSGEIGKLTAVDDNFSSLAVYGSGFAMISSMMILVGFSLQLFLKWSKNEHYLFS